MDEREESELREKLDRLKNDQGREHTQHEPAPEPRKKGLLDNRYTFLAIVVAILVLNLVLRLGLAQYAGFFEPDGFFHYSVISQAILTNHYIVPINSTLSGFPLHNKLTEPGGFYYVTIIPYILLQFLGISYYNIMRYIPLLFGMLDAIGVYFLAKYLTNSRVAGLLAMLFISISSGDIARTAALVYRGDGFVTIFVLLVLIFFVKCATVASARRRYIYATLAGVLLGTSAAIWGGAPFGFVVYILALIAFIIYSFIKGSEHLLRSSVLLSLSLLLAYLVEWAYIGLDVIRYVPSLGSVHFFIFYVPLLAGSLFAYYAVKNRHGRLGRVTSTWQTRAYFTVAVVVAMLAVIIAVFYGYISTLGGAAIGTGSLGTTIQELQRPTLIFIWESFSYQILLAPIGVVVFLVLGRRILPKDRATLAAVAFIAVLAYFAATSYLQYGAIRYNSLVSAPIAIFAAYTVYAIPKFLYKRRRAHTYAAFVFIGLFVALIALNAAQTYVNSFTSGQADGINAQFLAAMTWMRGNTPQNATVLALWPDGSVVEGWANRTSYMDSVGGQTNSRIYNFSRWLFSGTPDAQYLFNASRPQYFVVRGYWIQELGGIATEGGISNTSPYGYDQMSSLNIQRSSNLTVYLFNSSVYPYYSVELEEHQIKNGTANFAALLGTANSQSRLPLKSVIFINQSGGPYSEAVSQLNKTLNFTFVVYFQGAQITGGAIVGSGMPGSNFFRFTALCNLAACPYNDSGVTMQVVYQNADTKIIKINYPG